MNASQLILKIIVLVHFNLVIWASMSVYYLPPSYLYMNAFILAFGFWGIVNTESTEPILMFLILILYSVIQDCIFIGIYQPRGYDAVENSRTSTGVKSEFRFSLGMSIVNLLIKPLTGFLLYRIMKSRGGEMSDLNIPGIDKIPGFGAPAKSGGRYENIDNPTPYNSNIETASGLPFTDKPASPH